MTGRLWRSGGSRQGSLGTTAVQEPKSQVRALGLEEETWSLLESEYVLSELRGDVIRGV